MGIDRAGIEAANDATYAAWNARDSEAVAAVFAADAELLDAGTPAPVNGREAIRARAAQLLAAFPDFAGGSTSSFLGMAPTGRSISVEGCTFSRFDEDGLVVRDVNFWDVPGLLAQLTS